MQDEAFALLQNLLGAHDQSACRSRSALSLSLSFQQMLSMICTGAKTHIAFAAVFALGTRPADGQKHMQVCTVEVSPALTM